MNRYIDADTLKIPSEEMVAKMIIDSAPSIDIDDYVPKDFHDKTCEAMAKRHQEEIANMVEVVRCKECKYGEVSVSPITGLWCTRFEINDMSMEDDDFCSYGEREGE